MIQQEKVGKSDGSTRKISALATKSSNPILTELDQTVRESAVDPDSLRNPYNTDDLYIKAGNYSIYEDMMKDDQVSVAMAIKKDLIIGSGFQFVCESEEDEEIRKDLEIAFHEDIVRPFEDALLEVLTAYEFGFSVTEKQFQTRDDGSLTLKNLKTRHPVSWLFHQDKYGNVIRYEQQGTDSDFINIDPNAIIHFVNNPRFENPYGTSDLRSAYQAYFIKKQIIRYYAIFMEKAASPIPVAKYDENVALDADVQAIHDTIKKFQASTALTIPKSFEVDFLDAKGDGSVYTRGIDMFNMFIGRSLFVPDLLGFQGSETSGGSQALGQEQMQVFFKHIYRRRRAIESLINKHLVWPIVFWNYGAVDKYPKFKFKPIEESQAANNAKLWLEAIRSPSYTVTNEDINHFKKIIDFPETDFEALEAEQDAIEEAAREANPTEIENTEAGDDEKEQKEMKDHSKAEHKEMPEAGADKKEKQEFKAVYNPTAGDYHAKVNFKALESHLDSAENLFLAQAAPIIEEIFGHLYEDLAKPSAKKIDSIKVRKAPMGKLKKLLNNSLWDTFETSRKIAQTELFKSNFALTPAEAFLELLEKENFEAIGAWEYRITKAAKTAMIAALKDGKPISEVIAILDEKTKAEIVTATERYARTKFTEVMNKGRLEYFKETGVVAAYQYSAILDDRTTTICRGLHGKVFKAGTQPVPPMHFNCRSLLIPITKFEEFEPDTKVGGRDIDQFIDDEKGDGFAKG